MPTPYASLIIVHAIAGLTALAVLPVPLIVRKGGRVHILAGKIFFWAMVCVGVTGLGIAALWGLAPAVARPGLAGVTAAEAAPVELELGRFAVFFATIGVLTLDAVTQGRTAFWSDQRAARRLEIPLGVALSLAGAALGVVAWQAGSWLFGAFAIFALQGALRPSRFVRALEEPSRAERVDKHLQAMLGGATAAFTAFSALTLRRFIPGAEAFGLAFWLVPVALGVSASIAWSRRVRNNNPGPSTTTVAA